MPYPLGHRASYSYTMSKLAGRQIYFWPNWILCAHFLNQVRLVGLGVWFSLRVREVPGSNPGRAQCFFFQNIKIWHLDKKAPARFELAISCLLDRRFNQLSHGAGVLIAGHMFLGDKTNTLRISKKTSPNVGLEPTTLRLRVSCSTDWASRASVLTFYKSQEKQWWPFVLWHGIFGLK